MKIVCERCSEEFTSDEMPRRGPVCFRCHLRTVEIGFTYGKSDFHGPTVRERQRKQVEEASAAGIVAQPVGKRWV